MDALRKQISHAPATVRFNGRHAMALSCWLAFGVALPGDGGDDGLLAAIVDVAVAATVQSAPPSLQTGSRWEPSFAAFAVQDQATPPQPGGTVFTGSSSIVLWSGLERQFPRAQALARGFGGSHLADCARHVDRLVLPYRPRQVVLYAGENDLAAGATPQQVSDSYRRFVEQVHAALPSTRVVFISIKPSPSRAGLLPQMRQANALIAEHAATDPRQVFVDVFSKMIDGQGQPRADLFEPDALHLNATGYELWARALGPHLI